jgi:hypothetical protein
VVPLVAIFTAASLGLISERLMEWLKSQLAWLKLAMAVFSAAPHSAPAGLVGSEGWLIVGCSPKAGLEPPRG